MLATDLPRRVREHKNKLVSGFTAKYGVDRLVWFEGQDGREAALRREKQIKEWKRDWKINLIEANNPQWADLAPVSEIHESVAAERLVDRSGNGWLDRRTWSRTPIVSLTCLVFPSKLNGVLELAERHQDQPGLR